MRSNPTIRCIILDDEFPAVQLLADYVLKTAGLELILKTNVPTEAIACIAENKADLIFLDVQMPELTGIEVMNIIRHSQTKVILTTAYAEYALAGYEHDIVDYLLKPVTFERFLIAAGKAKERLNLKAVEINNESNVTGRPEYVFVKTEYRIQKILLSSILYIEALGDYIAFHTTTNGKILSLERMKNIEETLPKQDFIRIHKSYLINIHQIDYLERARIIINKEYLPIGESYKEAVKQKLGL
ncbi:MAG: LytTR family DNA-binding domain-containing protein [Bacteroidota bacterium]